MSTGFVTGFCLTVFVASIIPGPSMLLALTHGMQYGLRRTLVSALGNLLVTLVQAFVSIAGLGAVLLASETCFSMIKWAGAAYLIYMGITLLLAKNLGVGLEQDKRQGHPQISLKKMFAQSAWVTASNPKAIVFFTAVFPQFIHPGQSFWLQCTCLLALMSIIAVFCFMLYALGGQKIVSLFSNTHGGKWVKRIVATSFIGAGIGLVQLNAD